MMGKTRLGVIFGGKSSEHEVSCVSAKNVMQMADKDKFEIVCIGIDRDGKWLHYKGEPEDIEIDKWQENTEPIELLKLKEIIDFAFPVLHGMYGEDGTIQGLFEMLDIPYAGCGVLASSLCMDKGMAKEIFVRYGIPTCRYRNVTKEKFLKNPEKTVDDLKKHFSGAMFVKPSNLGSSVGISRAETKEELMEALKLAVKYDRRIIVEEAIDAREVEVAVTGNDELDTGYVGEIEIVSQFYDYEAKYSEDSGTKLNIPANLDEGTADKIVKYAHRAYRALDCAGFARLDFFVERGTGRILINEINTIPGFTKYSMFPVMFEKKGLPNNELIERIVNLGYERYNDKNNRETTHRG